MLFSLVVPVVCDAGAETKGLHKPPEVNPIGA
jgi:hypothetical protein